MSNVLDLVDGGSHDSFSGRGLAAVAGLPFVPVLPRKFIDDPHLVMLYQPVSPIAERYRLLRFRLEQPSPGMPHPVQVAVVTSAVPGEGKTTTALNLALACAEDREQRVLLVDADLRHPSISRHVTPETAIGLSDVLAGESSAEDALIRMTDTELWILPAGAPSRTPLDLLRTAAFGRLTTCLRRWFDRIVIDTPPTVAFTDAAVIATHADGALLVVRAGVTTAPLIERATESLAGTRLLGAVLNDVEFTPVDRYYYRYDDNQPGRYAYPEGDAGSVPRP